MPDNSIPYYSTKIEHLTDEDNVDDLLNNNTISNNKNKNITYGNYYLGDKQIYPAQPTTYVLNHPEKYKKLLNENVEGNHIYSDVYYSEEKPTTPEEHMAYDSISAVKVYNNNGVVQIVHNDYRLQDFTK
jgi:hypothetical protein